MLGYCKVAHDFVCVSVSLGNTHAMCDGRCGKELNFALLA